MYDLIRTVCAVAAAALSTVIGLSVIAFVVRALSEPHYLEYLRLRAF
jgi:hypothetical protein